MNFKLPIEDLESIFERLKRDWPKNSTILITGGTGFFGQWIIESVAYIEKKTAYNNKFIIISRQNADQLFEKHPILKESCFELIQSDLSVECNTKMQVDYILHAATDVNIFKQSDDHNVVVKQLIQATENIIKLADDCESFRKILYVSSGAVYERNEDVPLKEDISLPINFNSSYAKAKRECEILVEKILSNNSINGVIARCFAFLGPEFDSRMAIMEMILSAVHSKTITVRSPLTKRSFMYMSDLVCSIFKLLFSKTKHVHYNIGSDEVVNFGELANLINESSGESCTISLNQPQNSNWLSGQFYYPDVSRLREEFPSALSINLAQAIKKTMSCYKGKVHERS